MPWWGYTSEHRLIRSHESLKTCAASREVSTAADWESPHDLATLQDATSAQFMIHVSTCFILYFLRGLKFRLRGIEFEQKSFLASKKKGIPPWDLWRWRSAPSRQWSRRLKPYCQPCVQKPTVCGLCVDLSPDLVPAWTPGTVRGRVVG
jgi:hypothetical protein